MDRRKRVIARRVREGRRAAEREEFPLSAAAFGQIFEMLDERLAKERCDHSLRFTAGWLSARGLDPVPVVEWLCEHGGSCDCEVRTNVADAVLAD